jgi:hypothetical protein
MTPTETESVEDGVAIPEQCPSLACGSSEPQLRQQPQPPPSQWPSNGSGDGRRQSSSSSGIRRSSSGGNGITSSHDHALSEVHRHHQTSKVECLAWKMETRRAQRIPVTPDVRTRLLHDCRKIAPTRIPLQALLDYRQRVQQQVDAQPITLWSSTLEWLGFRNTPKVLLQVLNRAVIRVQDEERQHDWFYYQDFSHYFTTMESQWPFLRNAFYVSLGMLVAFYIGTAVLFCTIMQDPGVCPRNGNTGSDNDNDATTSLPWYAGWLTAIYFASTTMSTVGYGDVSVMIGHKGGGDEPPAEKWRIFIGALYMMVALLVVILAFSNVIQHARTS